MASKYLRGTTWWVSYRLNGKNECRSLKTKNEDVADAALRRLELRIAERTSGEKIELPETITFGEILDRFLEAKRETREENTWKNYEKHAVKIRELFPCSLPFVRIRPQHIREFIKTRHQDGLSDRTLNHYHTTISTIFKWARRNIEGAPEENPATAVEKRRVRMAPPEACPEEVYLSLIETLRSDATGRGSLDERYIRELLADFAEVLWWTGWRTLAKSSHISSDSSDPDGPSKLAAERLDHVAKQVYFASGAFTSSARDRENPTPEQQQRFYSEAEGLMNLLADAGVASVAFDLIRTLEHFRAVDPRGVLVRAHRAMKAAQTKRTTRDYMGAVTTIRLVEAYLAEDRPRLAEDSESRQALVGLLGIFVEAGWPAAYRLTYRLWEVFR
jgi:hypothetical protein